MEDTRAESLPIGAAEAAAALQTLQRYKAGKAALDKRLIDNELWFRMGHWKNYRDPLMPGKAQPSSGWLFNSIANKHADAMDNYPEPMVLPRAADDQATAQALSSVLPVVLEQADYEQVYSDVWWRKLKQGTGVTGIFWNPAARGGLGDIAVRSVNLLMLYWEPGVQDIQDSPDLFHLSLEDTARLTAQYPQLTGHAAGVVDVPRYIHEDGQTTANKSVVVDWYYKRPDENGKLRLHYCKLCNGVVLYASQNDPALAARGLYDHGKYPFVFDPLFVEEDSPAGFGYIDVMKDCQNAIDKMNHAMDENVLRASRQRYVLSDTAGVNEEELADLSRDIVHVVGRLNEDSFRPLQTAGLQGNSLSYRNSRIEELKEISGNRDMTQGGTAGGVTAASAIAALQEAGSKLSRDMLKSAYRAFARECYLIIDLMRQFYDEERVFRVIGPAGGREFVPFSGAALRARPMGLMGGVELGSREPVFDILVSAEKKSTFSRLSQNETAKECYQLGFFAPQNADAALAALEMMDFEGIEKVRQRVRQNGTLAQKLTAAQMQIARFNEKLSGAEDNLSTRALAKNLSGALRQLSRRESPWHKDEVCKYCQGLPLWGRWHCVSNDGEGEEAENRKRNLIDDTSKRYPPAALCRGAAGLRKSPPPRPHPPGKGEPSGHRPALGGRPPRPAQAGVHCCRDPERGEGRGRLCGCFPQRYRPGQDRSLGAERHSAADAPACGLRPRPGGPLCGAAAGPSGLSAHRAGTRPCAGRARQGRRAFLRHR